MTHNFAQLIEGHLLRKIKFNDTATGSTCVECRKLPWRGAWLAFQVNGPSVSIYLSPAPRPPIHPLKIFPRLKTCYGKDGNKCRIHKLLLWTEYPVLESSDKPPSRVWLRTYVGGNAKDCRDWEPVGGKKFADRGHERSTSPPSPISRVLRHCD